MPGAFDPGFAAMSFGYTADQCQPQPWSAALVGCFAGRVQGYRPHLIKFCEDQILMLGVDANASISDGDLQAGRAILHDTWAGGDEDFSAIRRVLDSIDDQL